jgi:hypothetical protein
LFCPFLLLPLCLFSSPHVCLSLAFYKSCSCKTVNRFGNGIVGKRHGLGLMPFLSINEAVNSPLMQDCWSIWKWDRDVVRFWCHFFLFNRSLEEGDEQ